MEHGADRVATEKTNNLIAVSTLSIHTQPTLSWADELEENQGTLRRQKYKNENEH